MTGKCHLVSNVLGVNVLQSFQYLPEEAFDDVLFEFPTLLHQSGDVVTIDVLHRSVYVKDMNYVTRATR